MALVPTPAIDESKPSHPVVWNEDIVGDVGRFSSFNRRSSIKRDKFDRMGDDFNFADEYFVIMPDNDDKVYTEVRYQNVGGLGVSRASFSCGLRVPIHPFVRKVILETGVALGQIAPNSFYQINAFIYRCKLKGVELSTRLFWHHFNLTGSKKCPGFYAIGLRPKRQKWTCTVSNNKTAYTEWVYLFGPGLDGLNNWAAEPKSIPKRVLEDAEKAEYVKLLEDWTEDDIMSALEAVDERHLLKIHVSGRNVELEKKKEKMRANTATKARARQPSTAIDKATVVVSTDNRTDDRDGSQIEAIEVAQSRRRPRNVMDLTADGLVSKCFKVGEDDLSVQLPHSAMVTASSSSVTLGHQVASIMLLPGDQDKRDLPLSIGNEQALAHATQAMMWIASQAKESLQASEARFKLQEDLEMERELKIKVEAELTDVNLKKDDLQKSLTKAHSSIEKLKMEVARAQKSEEEAQEFWYAEGLKDRLIKVRSIAGAKYTDFLLEDEVDPIKDIPEEHGDES